MSSHSSPLRLPSRKKNSTIEQLYIAISAQNLMALGENLITVPTLLVLSVWAAASTNATPPTGREGTVVTDRFVGAAYEHLPFCQDDPATVLSRAEALKIALKNVAVYEEQTKAAVTGPLRASIIVFPENGLYGKGHTRASIFPYLEEIVDRSGVACNDPMPGSELQTYLSCLARNHSLYLVANMGTKQRCHGSEDKSCPHSGWYQFNSNLVFDPDGELQTFYHKHHVGSDARFDSSPNVTHAVFETPFGKFGTLIGEDIFFNDTAVAIVENADIDSLAFSTSMKNQWPFPVATVLQRGFSLLMLINVLGSGLNDLDANITGSGLYAINYTSKGVFTHDNTTYHMGPVQNGGKLMRAVIPCKKPEASDLADYSQSSVKGENGDADHAQSYAHEPSPHEEEMDEFSQETASNSQDSHMISASAGKDKPIHMVIQGDNYTAVRLHKKVGYPIVCQHKHCCGVMYTYTEMPQGVDYYVAVFRGNHTFNGLSMEIRVCSLIKCPSNDLGSCGTNTTLPGVQFEQLWMRMSYSYKNIFVLPYVITTLPTGKIDLAVHDFMYKPSNLTCTDGFKNSLLSATLYTAYFDVY